MAELHSQKSKTESVGSSVDEDVTDDEYDLYDYYNEGVKCDHVVNWRVKLLMM